MRSSFFGPMNHVRRIASKAVFQAVLCFCSLSASTASLAIAQHKPPNILLVMLDDVGYMDLGAYGGDTLTPTIDKLGNTGAMFTTYYTTPQCGPSRASAMTGQANHQVGMGSIAEVLSDEMRELPAYSMVWSTEQKTVASRLKQQGYQTFVSGKWGIGDVGQNLPNRFGFDKSWVLDSTGASNYSNKSYLPIYKSMQWYEDGQPVDLPDDFYSSRNIVDKMISYVDGSNPEQPFFGYLSFQAIHVPVQAPQNYINKYDGVFDRGWDVMREERLQRAINLELVPESTRLSIGAYNKRSWDSLTKEEKSYWSRVMQVNSAMMESADFHLGRLLDYLKQEGKLDNTVVIVTSDNGPEFNTLGKTSPTVLRAIERMWMVLEGWDVAYENLGQPSSIGAIGHEWASVSAAPFHLFKFSAGEGGLRVPLVVSGPGVESLGFVKSRAQVADIVPTLLDVAGVSYSPDEFYGRSLVPVLAGEADQVYGENDSFAIEVSGAAALYRGHWKLSRTPLPYGDGVWQLFDLSTDPGEVSNVATNHPKLFHELLDEYAAYSRKMGVYEIPIGESARQQLIKNSIQKMVVNYWYVLLLLAFVLVVMMYSLLRLAQVLWSRR